MILVRLVSLAYTLYFYPVKFDKISYATYAYILIKSFSSENYVNMYVCTYTYEIQITHMPKVLQVSFLKIQTYIVFHLKYYIFTYGNFSSKTLTL